MKTNAAAGTLSEQQLNSLYRYALALSNHRDDAYDLLQCALEKYLIQLKCGQIAVESPPAFVRTLIRNRYIDQYRHRQRWPSESYEDGAAYDISISSLEKTCIDADSLRRIWRQLAVQDRDILYHWAVLGYSTDEVCEQLAIPRGTLLSRIHRLRKTLKNTHQDDSSKEQAG